MDPAIVLPPRARRKPVYTTVHGYTREDPYGWLRAANWREVMRDPSKLAPEIRAHLEVENAYARAMMADTETLQAKLYEEMRGRIKEEDSSVPAPDGPFAYLTKYVQADSNRCLARTPRDGGPETVLIDGNAEARGDRFSASAVPIIRRTIACSAWSFDERGAELYTILIRDLATGKELDDRIEATSGRIVWSADSRHVFYVRLDDNHRPSRLYRHRLGTPTESDQLVYEESDPGFFVGVGTARIRVASS